MPRKKATDQLQLFQSQNETTPQQLGSLIKSARAEQRRIMAKIERLAARIDEAQDLRQLPGNDIPTQRR